MHLFIDFLSNESCANLALALLHSLWQGALVGLVLFGLLKMLPARVSRLRYSASLLAQFSIVFVCLVTWSFLNYQPFAESTAAQVETPDLGYSIHQALSAPKVLIEVGDEASATSYTYLESPSLPWTVWIIVIWMIGVATMLVRMSVTIAKVNAIRLQCRPVTDQAILALVEQVSKSFRLLRPIKVMLSDTLQSPAVMGIMWPVILLPVSMVSGLSMDALRAILAHEMAHIRRWDYLVNLAQMLIEALLFFNPLVWWINRQIRLEREACCDALAISATGDRKQYLNALALVIEQFRAQSIQLQPAPSFSHEAKPGDMLDRIKRISHPDRRPNLWAPWPGFIAFLLISALMIGCMQRGADYFVESASEWMITEEQVEQIAAIEKSHDMNNPANSQNRTKVKISGTIRTWDGSPLPERVNALIETNGAGGTYTNLHVEDGEFSVDCRHGKIYLFTDAKGYATTAAGPFIVEPSGELKDVELVLKPGIEGRIKFVDPDKNPIPDMTLGSMGWWSSNDGSASSIGGSDKYQGDANGIVTILVSSDISEKIETNTPGYQHDEKVIKFKQDETHVWELKPAQKTTGVVVSKDSGEPIPFAELRFFCWEKLKSTSYYGNTPGYNKNKANMLSTHSDENGQFTLPFLRDDTVYTYIVYSPDNGKGHLDNIRAGDKNLLIAIGDPISVKGKIIGSLDELPNKKQISYDQYYQLGQRENQTNNNSILKLNDGIGYFEINDLWPGKLTFNIADRTFDYDIQSSTDQLVIDLSKPVPIQPSIQSATRTVIMTFKVPPDAAPAKGSLEINYSVPDYTKYTAQHHYYKHAGKKTCEIVDGKIQLDIPVPGYINIHNPRLTGYWIQNHFSKSVVELDFPEEITIPLVPSGSIYGQINNNPADEFKARIIELKHSPFLEEIQHNLNFNEQHKIRDKFAFHPLPFGGVYAIALYNENTVITSQPIAVTSSNPTVEWNPVIPKGITVSGQVLKPDGSPLANAELSLRFTTGYSLDSRNFMQMQDFEANSEGRFQIDGINPDVSGHYTLAYAGKSGYQVMRDTISLNGENITLRLKDGLTAKGVVLFTDTGAPAQGVTVYGYTNHWEKYENAYCELPTNSKGEFIFSNLEALEYTLGASGVQINDYRSAPKITGGQVESVTVWVKPYE